MRPGLDPNQVRVIFFTADGLVGVRPVGSQLGRMRPTAPKPCGGEIGAVPAIPVRFRWNDGISRDRFRRRRTIRLQPKQQSGRARGRRAAWRGNGQSGGKRPNIVCFREKGIRRPAHSRCSIVIGGGANSCTAAGRRAQPAAFPGRTSCPAGARREVCGRVPPLRHWATATLGWSHQSAVAPADGGRRHRQTGWRASIGPGRWGRPLYHRRSPDRPDCRQTRRRGSARPCGGAR